MHLERRDSDKQTGPGEMLLVVVVVSDHMAHVLAEEALDALVELLDAVDVDLLHPVRAVGFRRYRVERRNLLG